MFGKGYTMTLNRVHDKINLREGDEVLPLTVDGDSMRMVAGLGKAQAKLLELKDDNALRICGLKGGNAAEAQV